MPFASRLDRCLKNTDSPAPQGHSHFTTRSPNHSHRWIRVNCERRYLDEIDDAVMLAKHAAEYGIEYIQIRPHEVIAWKRPKQVHLCLADPIIPIFLTKKTLPTP
jgi:hypothetical protein